MNEASLFEFFSNGVNVYAATAAARISKSPVCGFFPIKGKFYSNDLMIIGRAPNGWLGEQHEERGLHGVSANQLKTEITSKTFLATIETASFSDDPMDWVLDTWNGENYQTYRSSFWRVAKKVLLDLKNISELEEWPSHLAWSNLFKIAPYNGNNPGSLMASAQKKWCLEMLEQELQLYKPRHVLFMTGYEYWSEEFLKHLRFKGIQSAKLPYVEKHGALSLGNGYSSRIVVVPHPQGKPESEIAEQAVSAFTMAL